VRRSVILSASNSCFVACPGCYNYFGKNIADTEDVVTFIRHLRERFDLRKVTIGGGDPLTRPDITELLARVRALGLVIHLDTVGTAFLGDARIRFMGRGIAPRVDPATVAGLVDLVGVPLDGSTDAVNQLFRRFSSVGEQQAILSKLDALGAEVCINTVVHAGNVNDVENIACLLATHTSVRQWQLFQFMPIGPLGHRNRTRFEVSSDAYYHAVEKLHRSISPTVAVTTKSKAGRKNRYLLIDSAGLVWLPHQDRSAHWQGYETNPERIILGRISDPTVFDRVASWDAVSSRLCGHPTGRAP
jgi:MoaA/NifB/PqqE/SkfB family radical SAM enzyme